MLDRWVTKGYLNADCVTGDFMGDITAISTAKAGFDFIQNVAITMGLANVNPDGNMGMMPIPSNSASDEPSLISGEGVALGIWKDTKHKAAAEKLLNYLAQPEVAAKVCVATGNVPALTNVKVDLGVLQQYIDKYSDVEAFNYFDRAYCPSGMWDVMCATGQDVLAQKSGAVAESAKQMKSTFDALWGN
jgi:raffinose/stachyose/melibiose transport system substrate-binding protein